ncbi:DUF3857 domain-containing protein [uncultured Croceitalea sp.]|uniref:DUF3857 domain-containing protein n=1 Tax=uncultured Croceitalea sp. TaxID=1798908 RepID=UPI00374FC6AA
MRLLYLLIPFFSISQDLDFSIKSIDEKLLNDTNAVVRLDEMKINILASDRLAYTICKVVTVLNKKADENSITSVSYDKETKIRDLGVFVYNAEGGEIEKIKKKEFKDYSAADGFSLYTDNRMLYHKYTPITYPYTIAVKYTIETTDTAFFPPWYFIPNYLTSIEKSYLEIRYQDLDLKPDVKEFNLDNLLLEKSDDANSIIYKAKNILPIRFETLGPSFRDIVPRLAFRMKKFNLKGEEAHVEDWRDMGFWMNEALLKNREILEPETIKQVKELVVGVDDNLEKARIVYKYVQENTRYISVQIGIGGWKPISAIEVDKVKYGDCKGLSNYTYALLKAVDVPSYYTIISAGKRKVDLDKDFSRLQGNHAILAIPYKDDYYWIDCTSQIHPFGFLGDFTDDRLALVVTPEGGKLVKTVAYLNEENYQKTSAKYSIEENGSIYGEVKMQTGGIQYDNRFSIETKSKEDITTYYKDYWDNINNLQIENIEFSNDTQEVMFEENISIKATDYASKSGNRMLFEINAFNNNSFVPDRYRNRKMPLEIQRGYLDKDEFKVQLPKDYKLEALPQTIKIENEFGQYSASYEHDASTNIIFYSRELFIKSGRYSKEKYSNYRSFRKSIAKNDNAKVVLIEESK